MIYHPAIYILSANIALILTVKYDKAFKLIAVSYPCVSLLALLGGNEAQSFEILGNQFLIDNQINSKIIGCVFLITSLAVNLYATNRKRKLEVISGGFYLAFSIICLFASDLISVFISLELMLIAACILILIGTTRDSVFAVKQYFLTHVFSGSLILTGINYFINKVGSAEVTNIASFFYTSEQSSFMASLILIGCLINAAAFPFSSWMINCYPESTSSGFLYLTTFTTKVSIILILKLFSGFEILKYFGIMMMIYGGIYACIENNLRRLFCYLSLSQMGFILTVISTGNEFAIQSAVLYMAIHTIYKLIFGLYTAILSDYWKIGTCDGLAQFSLPILNFVLVIGFLMLINFPFGASFMSKSVISSYIKDNNLTLVLQFLNIMSFLSLPLRQIIRKRNDKTVQLDKNIIISLVIPCLILIGINIYQLYYFISSAEYNEMLPLGKSLFKQLFIIAVGSILAFSIRLPRLDTRALTMDLLVVISNFFNYLLNSYKNFKNIPKENFEIGLVENKILKSLKAAHSQSSALAIIFLMLMTAVLILTQIKG